jgi:putative transposase
MTLFREQYRVESARMPQWDYRCPGAYFATICTHGMKCWLGAVRDGVMCLSDAGRIVEEEWRLTSLIRHHVRLDAFVVMPNHFHGVLVMEAGPDGRGGGTPRPETPHRGVSTDGGVRAGLQAGSLGSIIGQFKSVTTKRIRRGGLHDFRWQPGFYDHLVRRDDSLDEIRLYIRGNPRCWDQDWLGREEVLFQRGETPHRGVSMGRM